MTASMHTGSVSQACGSCSDNGSPNAGACSSGCSSAPAVASGWSFHRPRFFSGQLLTEDDLVQLTDYVSAKNRLHNRFLFGDGVVCGLEVACDPCGDGSVVVSPGYALDGCGNDIVVPVAHTLDVQKMVLELRRRTLGVDCPYRADASKGDEHVYRLVVRYLEQPCEPVLPYTTDDVCASQVSELSRIREGYSFELQHVRASDKKRGFERVFAGRLDSHEIVTLLKDLSQLALSAKSLESMLGAMIPPPQEASVSPLQDAHVAEAKNAAKEEPRADEPLPDKVKRLLRYARLVTRYDQRLDRQQSIAELETLRMRIVGEKGTAGLANEVLQSPDLSKLSTADRASVTRLAQIAQRWCQPNLPREELQAPEPRALAAGVVFDPALEGDTLRDLTQIRDRLSDAAAHASTDGVLKKEIDDLRLSDPCAAVAALKTMALRLVRDFLFGALLPGCNTDSTDAAVELACITVRDGVVIQVRTVARRFVAAPASLRFWSPEHVSPQAALPKSSALAGWVESVTCQSLPEVDLKQFEQILKELPAEESPSRTPTSSSAVGAGRAGGSCPPAASAPSQRTASQLSNPAKPSASMTPPPLGGSSQRREPLTPGQSQGPGTGPVPGPLSGGRRG